MTQAELKARVKVLAQQAEQALLAGDVAQAQVLQKQIDALEAQIDHKE